MELLFAKVFQVLTCCVNLHYLHPLGVIRFNVTPKWTNYKKGQPDQGQYITSIITEVVGKFTLTM